MGSKTAIEWTDATWNPLRGCSRVSEGCRNCYAERVAARFSGMGLPYEGLTTPAGTWNGEVSLITDHLTDPLHWKKPRMIFVNSMSDLFHENVREKWIDRIFAVMALCPQHTFQVLTKRPERMAHYFNAPGSRRRIVEASEQFCTEPHTADFCDEHIRRSGGVLPNVWLGVSVEDQPTADERIPHLLRCPAAVRWLSVEPMLGPVEIKSHLPKPMYHCSECGRELMHNFCRKCDTEDNTATNQIIGIDWVVCGGESGPGARPMHPDWARSLRDQCVNAGVPFFFKRWGEWCPATKDYGVSGSLMPESGQKFTWIGYDGQVQNPSNIGLKTPIMAIARVGKKAAGRMLDGRTHDAYPEARA